ncbi:cadherin-like domain-containing protein [Pseudomonas stutzeri]|nr:cadherin-like domain-containing protein [Stutzerimonas stutzeri]
MDGDSLSIASVTSGTGGTAVLNADGTVTFTPDADFNGVAVAEGGHAVEVGIRGEGHRAVGIQHRRAAGAAGHAGDAQAVAVHATTATWTATA